MDKKRVAGIGGGAIAGIIIIVTGLVFVTHTQQQPAIVAPVVTATSTQAPAITATTKTTHCLAHAGLPDSACTPGAILNVTNAMVCVSGYSSGVRNVPQSEKDQVYAEYGIASHTSGQYEVDHLISLELGGSNDIKNLWPELASPKPGFHEKDSLENYLHAQVCAGKMSLAEAQHGIASNWLVMYSKMKGTPTG